MLKLEDVYDVVIAKDGQEAYDVVKQSMEEGKFFNLIFMDIQVSLTVIGHQITPLTYVRCQILMVYKVQDSSEKWVIPLQS
jgi:CheY-like chemotaxis protein